MNPKQVSSVTEVIVAVASWEAKRIQALALAKAKALAMKAKEKAEETRESTFSTTDELTITINGVTMTFETIALRDAWLAKNNQKSIELKYREEFYVEKKESWEI